MLLHLPESGNSLPPWPHVVPGWSNKHHKTMPNQRVPDLGATLWSELKWIKRSCRCTVVHEFMIWLTWLTDNIKEQYNAARLWVGRLWFSLTEQIIIKTKSIKCMLEVGHSGGKGIPLDLDGRKPCPKTYGITSNKRFKDPFSIEEWLLVGTGCSTSFTSADDFQPNRQKESPYSLWSFQGALCSSSERSWKENCHPGHSRASINHLVRWVPNTQKPTIPLSKARNT